MSKKRFANGQLYKVCDGIVVERNIIFIYRVATKLIYRLLYVILRHDLRQETLRV